METMQDLKVELLPYNAKYDQDFYNLNVEWLEKYFYVEPYDKEVLSNPSKYIIEPGGEIFYAKVDNVIAGTVALIKRGANEYELSKMAVTENFKGLRIGQKLMYAAIDYAGQHNVKRLFLDSNTTLVPALTLYRKVGFKEIAQAETPYERSDIRMELFL